MDFLYSEINANVINDATPENAIIWKSYTALPAASAANYMQIGVVTVDSIDSVYLCVLGNYGYEWKLLTAGAGRIPQLSTPVVIITSSVLSWSGVDGALSYTVYNGNTKIAEGISGTTFDLSSSLSEPGIYYFKVQAIGDGINYRDSEQSNLVTYTLTYTQYWGATYDVPIGIDDSFEPQTCSLTLKTDGIIHYFTTKTEGEIRGKHCVYAYPTYYGDLRHIFCNDITSIDLLDQWTKKVVIYNGMSYNMYYANQATKDVDSKYQYLFIL